MSIEVRVINRNIDQALKILRRQISREGLFRTLQDKVAYSKPGDRARRKRARAESRRWKSRARAEKARAKVIER